MGCGKTTIGKKLARKLDYKFTDCDEYLEKKKNTTINECFSISEEYFRKLESECLYEISQNCCQVIATGGGMVLKSENIDIFKDDLIIFINRPIELIITDVDKESRPLIKNSGNKKIVEIYNNRIDLYKKSCDFEILNNGKIDSVISKICEFLESTNK